MGKIDDLADRYAEQASVPWMPNLPGAQRVMMLVYEKDLERVLRARIGEFDDQPDSPMAPMVRSAQYVAFTPAFNASGQPAISLPLHTTANGLPVGVQLVAAYGREDVLFRVASQIEQAQPWIDRRPAI
jgi:Asp-tRNA(Asn)/Glu-tRNA(Gln) amidotransferase A subunit family amidase